MENKPSQEFIDRHMTGTVESVMVNLYLNRNGKLPTNKELADLIRNMPPTELVNSVRSHKSTASIQALLKDDAEIRRWAKAVADA